METLQWIVATTDADLARHLMSRLGTALRLECDRFDGARAVDGSVVFGGTFRGHLVSLAVGREPTGDRLAVRLGVSGNFGAKAAAVAFPATLLVALIAALRLGGARLLVAGLVLGAALAALVSYGTFLLGARMERGAGSGSAAAAAGSIGRALEQAAETLGVTLVPGPAQVAGIDGSARRDPEWSSLATSVVESLT
ncbi:MAG: hypothetical protein H6698_07300 [Myxococcales bacterium]|nr:hypothetical protein [Myxococcales bacterium]MCB9532294.1 hypothetical protein [Myxococcales bacterium]MCB9534112.1 hypothetical protein [Myxococcales bacterium]